MLSIEELRRISYAENIAVTQHSRKRMSERGIVIADVMSAITNAEIIELYPDNFSFPNGLILGITK